MTKNVLRQNYVCAPDFSGRQITVVNELFDGAGVDVEQLGRFFDRAGGGVCCLHYVDPWGGACSRGPQK